MGAAVALSVIAIALIALYFLGLPFRDWAWERMEIEAYDEIVLNFTDVPFPFNITNHGGRDYANVTVLLRSLKEVLIFRDGTELPKRVIDGGLYSQYRIDIGPLRRGGGTRSIALVVRSTLPSGSTTVVTITAYGDEKKLAEKDVKLIIP